MSTKTLTTSRDPKGRDFMAKVEAAYDKASLDGERAQQLNESAEFVSGLRRLIERCSATNRFAGEEAPSTYGYLSGYERPVAISDQIDIMRSHWPQLKPDLAARYYREAYPKLVVPNWVEGPFCLIRPGFFSNVYGEEVEEVLKALAKDRRGKFINYREGRLGQKYLRQSEQTLASLQAITEAQRGSDILIVPAQFGIRFRGKSVRRSRALFVTNEYGQGVKDGGTMLLTHPIRLQHRLLTLPINLQHRDDLWLDFPGDEYSDGGDGRFEHAPCFRFREGRLGFAAYWVTSADEHYGSVSGFVPQASIAA